MALSACPTCKWAHPLNAPAVIGYVRVSMAREEMISPELQTAAIEDYCARKKYHLDEVIPDLDATGRNFARKGIQQAIERVENAGVSVIVVWKFSRFGRSRLGNATNLDRVESVGGRLESATEEVDATTAIGKFTRGMLTELAAFESDRIGEGWRETHAHRRANGLPHHGQSKFGYQYHRATRAAAACPQGCEVGACETGYVPDPETAPILRQMYLQYNSGRSFELLAEWANRQGAVTTAGKPWSSKKLRRYLDAGFGAGFLQVHDGTCTCRSPSDCRRKTSLPGAHEPVIESDEWATYLRQRKARSRLAPRTETPVYPLSGLPICGRCQGRLNARPHVVNQGEPATPGYLYVCRTWATSRGCQGTWVKRATVEAAVLEWLEREAAPELERRAAMLIVQSQKRTDRTRDREQLVKESAMIDKALTQLTVDKAKGLTPEAAYVAARDQLLGEQTELGMRLEALKEEQAEMEEVMPVTVVEGLISEWHTLPAAARRVLLSKLITRIEVTSPGRGKARIDIVPVFPVVL
ncbi:recombinase family protein [Nonomuraea sp. NPDC002799]